MRSAHSFWSTLTLPLWAFLFLSPPLASLAHGEESAAVFSALKPGDGFPGGWRVITLPRIKPNALSLVAQDAATVLQVESRDSSGSLGVPLAVDLERVPMLRWRWKVDRVLDGADMKQKSGDDFAARLYVFFDVPLASLPFLERSKISLARLLSGTDVPTAALCYVWDNRHPVGSGVWSPYSNRLHAYVVESGSAHVGEWRAEARDVAADFRAAFGHAPPRVTGIALGNDTDNTHKRVTVWFGDAAFGAR